MERDVATLLKEALRMSVHDRAALAEALLASLDEDVDDDADAVWRSELERRIAELDVGAGSPIPWHAVRERLFERARRRAMKRLREGLELQWLPGTRDELHRR